MKFQMIIAACLVFGAQMASAVAKSDCQMNANQGNGVGMLTPAKALEKIENTEIKTASAQQTSAPKSAR